MSKRLKILLAVSLVFNLLVLAGSSVVVYKKGLSFVFNKAKSVVGKADPNAYYVGRTSIYDVLPPTQNAIVFLGDSLTDYNEWHEVFQNPNIVSRGLTGDDTTGVLKRLDNVIKLKPTKLFIMVGTNDLNEGKNIPTITANYKQILQKVKADSPDTKIYIQSVLPINEQLMQAKRPNNDIIELNKQLKSLADNSQATYIDLFSHLTRQDGQLDPKYTFDGVHINGAGYLIWKNGISQYVN